MDQRRQPFFFNVAVSVASAVVLAVGGRTLRVRFLTETVIPTWLVLAMAVGVATLVVTLLRRGQRLRRRVFLLIPAFSEKHWLAELVQQLHHVLDRHGYELAIHIPAEEFSRLEQKRHLGRILKRSATYDGGIILAADPAMAGSDLEAFCGSFSGPVVFADIRPFDSADRYPANSSFVGYRAADIGARAASFAARALALRDDPLVLAIGSTLHAERQLFFAAELARALPGARIEVTSSGRFVRARARDIVADSVRQAAATGHPLDAIFCTNDEMALGAVDAITAAGITDDTMVIGVDGTREAVALIRSGRTPLRATVRQDAQRVAEVAVDNLLRMLAGERPPPETFLDPELIPTEPNRAHSAR